MSSSSPSSSPSIRFSNYSSFEEFIKREGESDENKGFGFHCVDSTGKTIYTNATIERIYGLSMEKIKGMTIFDFFPNEGRDQAEHLFNMYVNDQGNYSPKDNVICLSSTDGEALDSEILISQAIKKVIIAAQILVIYKRRKNESNPLALTINTNTSPQQFTRAFSPQHFPFLTPMQIMKVLYSTGDMKGIYRNRTCLFMNEASRRQLGYLQEEFVGQPFEQFVFPEDQQKALDVYGESEMVLDTFVIEPIILRFVKKNGDVIYFQLKIACIRNVEGIDEQLDQSPLISISYQDVTHLKTHIRIMGHELRNLLGPVTQIQSMKTDHILEMRNLIANSEFPTQKNIELLTHLKIIESYGKLSYARVDAATKRCTREINQFARAGKIVLQNSVVNLFHAFMDCLEQWKIESQFLNINLHFNELPNIQDLLVKVDLELLDSVFDNFIRNSLRAVNGNEPDKRNVYFSIVKIPSAEGNLSLHFMISDEGKGFCDKEDKPLKLNKNTYAQAFPSGIGSNLKIVQNGLGLSYSNKLINLMGGELLLTNNASEKNYKNPRTVVEFTLTFELVNSLLSSSDDNSNQSISAKNSPAVSFRAFEGQDLEILLVEDEPLNGKMFLHLLDKYKCRCSCAMSGESAIMMCRKNKYDVIFMDFNLGSMTGVEVTKQILAKGERNEGTVVIGLTGEPTENINEVGAAVGMKQVLSKPMGRQGILDAIQTHLPGKKIEIKEGGAPNPLAKTSKVMNSSIISGIDASQVPGAVISLVSPSNNFSFLEANGDQFSSSSMFSMNKKLQMLANQSPPLSPIEEQYSNVARSLTGNSITTEEETMSLSKLPTPANSQPPIPSMPKKSVSFIVSARSNFSFSSGAVSSDLIIPLPVVREGSDQVQIQKWVDFVGEDLVGDKEASTPFKNNQASEKGTKPKGNSVQPALNGTDQTSKRKDLVGDKEASTPFKNNQASENGTKPKGNSVHPSPTDTDQRESTNKNEGKIGSGCCVIS